MLEVKSGDATKGPQLQRTLQELELSHWGGSTSEESCSEQKRWILQTLPPPRSLFSVQAVWDLSLGLFTQFTSYLRIMPLVIRGNLLPGGCKMG